MSVQGTSEKGAFVNRDTYTKINISEVKDSAAAHGLMTHEARARISVPFKQG